MAADGENSFEYILKSSEKKLTSRASIKYIWSFGLRGIRRGPVRNILWIVSGSHNLEEWVSRVAGPGNLLINVSIGAPPSGPDPSLIFVGCDLKCHYDKCLRKLIIPALFPNTPSCLARPVICARQHRTGSSYIVSVLNHANRGTEYPLILEELKRRSRFWDRTRKQIDFCILLQQSIVDDSVKTQRISDLAKKSGLAAATISRKFKEGTRVSLKAFLRTIVLCQCFWELISSSKQIKRIARDHGYRPASFSRAFHNAFGVWPKMTRPAG
jgi:AraC-like DNA-binding protein